MKAGTSELVVESRGRHLKSSAWIGDHGDSVSNEILEGRGSGRR